MACGASFHDSFKALTEMPPSLLGLPLNLGQQRGFVAEGILVL